jgi:hypothetical protein
MPKQRGPIGRPAYAYELAGALTRCEGEALDT